MKKRNLMTIVLMFSMLFLLAACSKKDKIALVSQTFTHELGEELSEDMATYVKATKEVMDKSVLDLSEVNSMEIGIFTAKVTYNKKDYPFTIEVVDTIAPQTKMRKTFFEIEAGELLDLEDLFEEIIEHDEFFVKFKYADVVVEEEALILDEPGDYDVVAELTDGSGNKSTFDFKVKVAEIGIPVISGIIDITIGPDETPDWMEGVTAYDTKDGDLTSKIKVDASEVDTKENGDYVVYYSVTDSDGNDGEEERIVTVEGNREPVEPTEPVETEDMTIPEIRGLTNITINKGDPLPDLKAGITAYDAKDGDLTAKIDIDYSEVDLKEAGEYEVYYAVYDKDDNEGVGSRFIIVLETEPVTEEETEADSE